MKKLFFLIIFLLAFTSCNSYKKISDFDEVKKIYEDIKPLSCQEKIKNEYWFKSFEVSFDEITAISDSISNFDELPPLPSKDILNIQIEDSIMVNYGKTMKDLKRANNTPTKYIFKCKNYYRNTHISLPIFNNDKTLAVIEDRDGTRLYKKNKNGKWKFFKLGLIRIY